MKLLSIILSVVALAAIGVGGTLAVFSDVQTSNGNSFTAGTLNLVSTVAGTGPAGKFTVTPGGDGINGNVVFGGDAEKLKPGESGSITWTLSNTGTIPGTLTMVTAITSTQGALIQPKVAAGAVAGPGLLDIYMGVKLTRDGTYLVGNASNYGTWADLVTAMNAENQSMVAGATRTYILSWSLASKLTGAGPDKLFGTADDTAVNDNIVQGDSLGMNVTFNLVQS